MGKTVVLIEPSAHVGGLTSGGLGMTDTGNRAVIGGLAREFYQRIRKHYESDDAWTFQKRDEFPYFKKEDDALWRFEPKVAEKTFLEMLEEADVTLIKGERLDLRKNVGVIKDHLEIREIVMESGKTIQREAIY